VRILRSLGGVARDHCSTFAFEGTLFAETLKKMVDNVDGGIAAVIMGLDGIPVETYVRQDGRVDVTTVGMEFSFILGQVRKAGDSLQVGGLEELSVKAQRLVLVCRMLSPQYFVAIAISPEGNFGKARYLARLATPALVAAL
jgi:predicted regulator of Ras-like GTPase activity (Roadblock/LC7/MglB family)